MIFELINVNQIKKKFYLGEEVEYLDPILSITFYANKIEYILNFGDHDELCLDSGGKYLYFRLSLQLGALIRSVNWEDSGYVKISTLQHCSQIIEKRMVPIYRSAAYEDDFTDPDYFGEGFDHS